MRVVELEMWFFFFLIVSFIFGYSLLFIVVVMLEFEGVVEFLIFESIFWIIVCIVLEFWEVFVDMDCVKFV